MRRHKVGLPFCVAIPDGGAKRRAFQQNAEICDLCQIFARNIGDEEPALLLRQNKPLARQAGKRLAKCRHADVILTPHEVKFQLGAGRKPAKDNILLDAVICAGTDGPGAVLRALPDP